MTRTESSVTQAFVYVAASLANGADVLDLFTGLTTRCAELLDIESAGLLLADPKGVLHVMAASTERTRDLEIFQLQRAEGPCLDSYLDGLPVSIPDLSAAIDRWPHFVPAARAVGFSSVHALPLRLKGARLGTLGLFGAAPGSLSADDLGLGQALADVASVALVQDRIATDQATLNEQLQGALTSRVVLEQAKGLLAQQGGLNMAEAFDVLRGYARATNRRLADVAAALTSRQLSGQVLLDHAAERADRSGERGR